MPGLSPWYEGERIEELAAEREAGKPVLPDVPEEETPDIPMNDGGGYPAGFMRAFQTGGVPKSMDDLLARYQQVASAGPVVSPEKQQSRQLMNLAGSLSDIASQATRVGAKENKGEGQKYFQQMFKDEDAQALAQQRADQEAFKSAATVAQLGRGLAQDQAKYQQTANITQQKADAAAAKKDAEEAERKADIAFLRKRGVPVDEGMSANAVRSLMQGIARPKEPAADKFGEREKVVLSQKDKFRSEPQIRAYEEVQNAYNQMVSAPAGPRGDQALITKLAKMLDPGSVVREGEYATTKQGFGALEQLQANYDKFKGTGQLTPQMRQEIMVAAKALLEGQKESAKRVSREYDSSSRALGLNQDIILGSYAKDLQEAAKTLTEADIDKMDEAQLKAYLGGK